jgi:hypothetical protein
LLLQIKSKYSVFLCFLDELHFNRDVGESLPDVQEYFNDDYNTTFIEKKLQLSLKIFLTKTTCHKVMRPFVTKT